MTDRVRFFRRKWPRRILRGTVGLVLFLIVGLLVARYIIRWRGQSRLTDQVAALNAADPRWRWDEVEFDRMLIPDDENSAGQRAELEAAVGGSGASPIGWPTTNVPPPNVFREPAEINEVNGVLQQYAEALEIAKSFADKPRGRYPLDFPADDFLPYLRHLRPLRNAVNLLDMDAEVMTRVGSPNPSRTHIQAMLNAAAALDGEPVVMSQFDRIGILNTAVRRVERTLALGVAPGDLQSLQSILLAETRTDFFTPGIRGDRAAMNRFVGRMESGELALVDWPRARDLIASSTAMAGPPPPPDFGMRVMVWAVVGTNLPANFASYLTLTTEALRVTDLPEPEQRAALPRQPTDFDPHHVLYRMSRGSIDRLLEAQLRVRALLRCAVVALAVEQFRLESGRWPATLAEVPKNRLPAIPLDPFDGTPVKFVRRPGGVTVYAIGPDGQDDGGVVAKGRSGWETKDVIFRLYDLDRRGLRVVPEAARPAPLADPDS